MLPGVDQEGAAVVPQQERDPLLWDVGQRGYQRGAGVPDDCEERASSGTMTDNLNAVVLYVIEIPSIMY